MIINRLQHGTAIHSRVELYANRTLPIIEMTVVRSNLALEPTMEMTYEQANELVDTLNRLIASIDRHAATMPVTQMHPRADRLLAGADQHRQVASPHSMGGADPDK
jgi:hypothetical protein